MADIHKKFVNTFKLNYKDEDIIVQKYLSEQQIENILIHLSFLQLAIKNVIGDKKVFNDIKKVKIINTKNDFKFNLNLNECKKACELFKTFFDTEL